MRQLSITNDGRFICFSCGGEKCTKLDLAHAYQQVMFDSDSRKLLTVNTHRGLFEPSRLKFGVYSATGIFQREWRNGLIIYHSQNYGLMIY